VTGVPAPRVGEIAASASIVLHELTPELATLEEAFLELTSDSVEFGHASPAAAAPAIDGGAR
jgi:ABC-2 type transport system ATP-binding protein